jgi:hypothetical protein
MTQLTIFEEPISTAKTEGKINVVSLFSGCGGMDLGFAQAIKPYLEKVKIASLLVAT